MDCTTVHLCSQALQAPPPTAPRGGQQQDTAGPPPTAPRGRQQQESNAYGVGVTSGVSAAAAAAAAAANPSHPLAAPPPTASRAHLPTVSPVAPLAPSIYVTVDTTADVGAAGVASADEANDVAGSSHGGWKSTYLRGVRLNTTPAFPAGPLITPRTINLAAIRVRNS